MLRAALPRLGRGNGLLLQQPSAPCSGAAASTDFDCVVIGAGVVGLACARALALAGRECLLVDSAGAVGTEQGLALFLADCG
jgi:heterodisulfide reductase subunit A-like polyferredoxin